MKKPNIIGLDVGNGNIKLVWDGDDLVYYNTVTEVKNEKMNKTMSFSQFPTFGYKGKKYQIGFAGSYGSGGISSNRYKTEEFKREALFAIAQVVKEKDEVIYLVTGVPAYHYDSDQIINDIKENLKGRHELTVDEKKVSFIIEDVAVLSQAMAAMFSKCFKYDRKTKTVFQTVNDEFLMKSLLFQDNGWGTTDFILINLSEGGVIKYDTIPLGMKEVTTNIENWINQHKPEYRIKDFYESRYKLDSDLRNGYLDLGNKKVNLPQVLDKFYNEHANEIALRARNMGFKMESYYRNIQTGGGAIPLYTAFSKVYEPTIVELMDNAQMANAEGYKIWGEQNYGK